MHPQVEHPYPHNYGDSAELLDMLAASGRVRLSLAGHFHPGSAPAPHGGTLHVVGRAVCEAPHPVTVIDIAGDGAVSVREVRIEPPPRTRTHVAVVSRDTLMRPDANPQDPGAVAVPADIAKLAARALVICTSDLGHPALAGMGWPELADWHDRLHLALAGQGLVLDGLYYTTRHAGEPPAGTFVPRIALRPGEAVFERIERDFGLAGLAYTRSNH
jgi:hypothetical protein